MPASGAPTPAHPARPGPRLPPAVVGLYLVTCICGMIDAACFLGLGGVFAEVMTGNLVLLCFAVGSLGTRQLAIAHVGSITAYVVVLAAFAVGAVAGGRLLRLPERFRRRRAGFAAEWVLLLAAVVVTAVVHPTGTGMARFVVTGILAFGMGIQNAMMRKWGVTDLATNVMTLTMAGLLADSSLAGGDNTRAGRRAASVGIFAASALLGAFLERFGVIWPMALALAVFTVALPILLQPAVEP